MIARILRALLEAHYRRHACHACPDFAAYLAEAERIAADLAALGPVVADDFDLGVTA